MTSRRVYDGEKHAHFLTFSCYKRRRLLAPGQAKRILLGVLYRRLEWLNGGCIGFVATPDHAHALVWFGKPDCVSPFMNKWKEETSTGIKDFYRRRFPKYFATTGEDDPVWQARYYGFNVFSREKIEEKLDYMHLNPVRAGLVERAVDWSWSSARWYMAGRSVGVPITWPPGFD